MSLDQRQERLSVAVHKASMLLPVVVVLSVLGYTAAAEGDKGFPLETMGSILLWQTGQVSYQNCCFLAVWDPTQHPQKVSTPMLVQRCS